MDEWEKERGVKHRDTSTGKLFEMYWEIFNGLNNKNGDGVSMNDIIKIRRHCGMFGAYALSENSVPISQ